MSYETTCRVGIDLDLCEHGFGLVTAEVDVQLTEVDAEPAEYGFPGEPAYVEVGGCKVVELNLEDGRVLARNDDDGWKILDDAAYDAAVLDKERIAAMAGFAVA